MSYTRIWLHCVWGTKNHYPFLAKGKKEIVIQHIVSNAKNKGIYIDTINGHHDHLHCLISLSRDLSISKTMQLIKGESAFWINKNKIVQGVFSWAVDYYAVSVSESQLEKVRNYIVNQERHHKKKTWQEEYDEFISDYFPDLVKG